MPGPIFLAASASYQRYLQDGVTGNLVLSVYEQTPDGDIIVGPGEVFCRLPGCANVQVPLSETRNLHSHLRGHGVLVAWTLSARISQRTKDAIVALYESLFAGL
ncbi:hypothetical protein N7537_012008 [Penicillium hordei]|uniref:Uncharacterized protein n=1 Tax=Penicillium hordei TaxID=40994 RepID=A0AAD6DNN7_9EURO|nr:uncharacterized protein N7537_012008 [Penicillium hordei]KAJ5589330.1 hypothetical protein N7537_012008 [Penicillium hordei]